MKLVLDSSAIVAIHLREPGYEELIGVVEAAEKIFVGAPTLLETVMVLTSRFKRDAYPLVFDFVSQIDAEVVAFTEEHYRVASQAYLRFGKGRHAASLNFGDCLSYASAMVADLPLLYIGDDFPRTDIKSAVRRH